MAKRPILRINTIRLRLIISMVVIVTAGGFLFNRLLLKQSDILYHYFIERPSKYNVERAERIAASIHRSFKEEIKNFSKENIRKFLEKYNKIPFLSANFIITNKEGEKEAVIGDIRDIDVLGAEYLFPIKDKNGKAVGDLLVYDINKEYTKGLNEYNSVIRFTRIFFIVLIGLLLSIIVIREYTYRIKQEKKIAEYDAMHDGLTGVYTHKHFITVLKKEINRARRYKRPLSLIMADIDYFKKFNDLYGHLLGDRILRKIARVIEANIRSSDIVARYGGEEFAILLPDTDIKGAKSLAKRLQNLTSEALTVADRIRRGVKRTKVLFRNKKIGVTVSMGISSSNASQDFKYEYLISQADQALYESKRKGRDRITLFNVEDSIFEEYK